MNRIGEAGWGARAPRMLFQAPRLKPPKHKAKPPSFQRRDTPHYMIEVFGEGTKACLRGLGRYPRVGFADETHCLSLGVKCEKCRLNAPLTCLCELITLPAL